MQVDISQGFTGFNLCICQANFSEEVEQAERVLSLAKGRQRIGFLTGNHRNLWVTSVVKGWRCLLHRGRDGCLDRSTGANCAVDENTWMFPKIMVPQNGWFVMENPIKMDDLGIPLFLETTTLQGKGFSHFYFRKLSGRLSGGSLMQDMPLRRVMRYSWWLQVQC